MRPEQLQLLVLLYAVVWDGRPDIDGYTIRDEVQYWRSMRPVQNRGVEMRAKHKDRLKQNAPETNMHETALNRAGKWLNRKVTQVIWMSEC